MGVNDNHSADRSWSDAFGYSGAIYPAVVPSNTASVTTNYLSVNGGKELKKRTTVRKFDEDGNIVEETVTEEYGDKEIVTYPVYPANPWYEPVTPWNPNKIYCGTTTVDTPSTTC